MTAAQIATERHIRMAAELYGARDTAKRLLGAGFKERMASFAEVINKVADRKACSSMQAAIEIAKQPGVSDIERVMVLAAVVELVEPSA
ncbi:hypothetical protein PEC18_18585 [Paucibacter sp. O1-1]|nr:hypothetical protein [Paucibacter sp. O1-1]MDA3827805.1 hypothetical protein [Paucibacter sp. O1-1]